MTDYRIADEPQFVRHGADAPVSGHYEAVFVRDDGERVRRFLTDKGRAEILRAMESGPAELSVETFERCSVEPTMEALLGRMDREAGEGA